MFQGTLFQVSGLYARVVRQFGAGPESETLNSPLEPDDPKTLNPSGALNPKPCL